MISLMMGNESGTLLCWLSTAPVVCEYIPLRRVAREGRQSALVTKAFLKTAPSRPMRSMLGVCRRLLPASEDSSHRTPSPRKKTKFGREPVIAAARVFRSCGLVAIAPAAAEFLRKALRE